MDESQPVYCLDRQNKLSNIETSDILVYLRDKPEPYSAWLNRSRNLCPAWLPKIEERVINNWTPGVVMGRAVESAAIAGQ
jgi:hypothetical protein